MLQQGQVLNVPDPVSALNPVNLEFFNANGTPQFNFTTAVAAATTAALPANTYANGTAGVGATLTGNSNAALSAQDGVTLTINQRLWAMNEAAAAHNGLYALTQVGSGSTPYILTRTTDANTATLLGRIAATALAGSVNGGLAYGIPLNGSAITVGTTALVPVLVPTGGAVAIETARAEAAEALLTPLVPTASAGKLNGSTALWADRVVFNGGSVSSASYNAVQQVEEMLRAFDLMKDLIYFSPFAGGNLASASTPLIDLYGNQLATVLSGSSFTEGSGLTGVKLQTGIILDYGMATRNGFAMGVYSLTNEAGALALVPTLGYNDDAETSYGLQPNYGGSLAFYWYTTAATANIETSYGDGSTAYPTQGVLIGARDAAGNSSFYRNYQTLPSVVEEDSTLPPLGQRLVGTSPLSSGAMRIDSTNVALGGAFVAVGDFNASKAAAMTFILQFLNKNLGTPRAVYPDGLS